MSEQKPALGRIVHYRAAGEAERHNGAEIHAAMITRVWGAECVNLKVFPDLGAPFDVSSVSLNETAARAWFWPPRV